MNNPKSPDSVASPRVFKEDDDDYDLPSLPQIPRSSDTGRSFPEQLADAEKRTTRKNSGGRKKRRRKSRKKKRKSRRKTRKKRRRKSRKKRKTRRRKKGGVKTAFKKTIKRSKTVSDLARLARLAEQSEHASRITRQGFKQPKKSSLSKHVMFRPISPQSQPSLRQQPSQGLEAGQQPLAQQPLSHQMGAMSINTPSPVSSGGEEITGFMNQ